MAAVFSADRDRAAQHWVGRHGAGWLSHYRASAAEPWRSSFLAALRGVAPFVSVIDLGCHCGVLMPLLQTASYNARVHGVDLSAEAIAEARRVYPAHRWDLASLMDWLPEQVMAGVRADVMVAASVMDCVPPEDIGAVIGAMATLTTKAIVLQAHVATPTHAEGRVSHVGVPEWKYDYASRFRAHGWRCTQGDWYVNPRTNQPSAVLTLEL